MPSTPRSAAETKPNGPISGTPSSTSRFGGPTTCETLSSVRARPCGSGSCVRALIRRIRKWPEAKRSNHWSSPAADDRRENLQRGEQIRQRRFVGLVSSVDRVTRRPRQYGGYVVLIRPTARNPGGSP